LQVMLTTKAPPYGSWKATHSTIGKHPIHSCGFTENVRLLLSALSIWL
jgi:hypothetical protein